MSRSFVWHPETLCGPRFIQLPTAGGSKEPQELYATPNHGGEEEERNFDRVCRGWCPFYLRQRVLQVILSDFSGGYIKSSELVQYLMLT